MKSVIRELHRIFSGCVEHWQRTSVEMPTCKIREQNITSVLFSKKISPVIFSFASKSLVKNFVRSVIKSGIQNQNSTILEMFEVYSGGEAC